MLLQGWSVMTFRITGVRAGYLGWSAWLVFALCYCSNSRDSAQRQQHGINTTICNTSLIDALQGHPVLSRFLEGEHTALESELDPIVLSWVIETDDDAILKHYKPTRLTTNKWERYLDDARAANRRIVQERDLKERLGELEKIDPQLPYLPQRLVRWNKGYANYREDATAVWRLDADQSAGSNITQLLAQLENVTRWVRPTAIRFRVGFPRALAKAHSESLQGFWTHLLEYIAIKAISLDKKFGLDHHLFVRQTGNDSLRVDLRRQLDISAPSFSPYRWYVMLVGRNSFDDPPIIDESLIHFEVGGEHLSVVEKLRIVMAIMHFIARPNADLSIDWDGVDGGLKYSAHEMLDVIRVDSPIELPPDLSNFRRTVCRDWIYLNYGIFDDARADDTERLLNFPNLSWAKRTYYQRLIVEYPSINIEGKFIAALRQYSLHQHAVMNRFRANQIDTSEAMDELLRYLHEWVIALSMNHYY